MRQLDLTLQLIDRITRPLRGVQAGITEFADKSKASFQRIAVGGAGLWGVGMAIKGALGPAIEMYDALQEQAARGIDSSALQQVERDANTFSMAYGKSAVEFVQSTADINAAIGELTGTELPKVTRVANLMAAAVGSSAAESAEFMGQLFGNFREEADRVGKVQFAEQLAEKMTFMRRTFGVNMGMVKDLMEGARGVGTNFGVGLNEQLAVMGELQRTLGSEASGAYESFMTGADEGAKKLGLSFKNTAGQMLSMPEILTKLQGKYGESIAGNLEAQKALDDAFGDSSAVVKQLWGNVETLQRNITVLGGSDGLKRTQEMASAMVKPWDRFMQILEAVRRIVGMTLIPVIYPFLTRLADMGQTFGRWMQMFPNIARVVGYVTLAVLSFAAVGALANVVMGVAGFVMLGLTGIWRRLLLVTKLYTGTVWLASKAVVAWNLTLNFLRGTLLAVRMAAVMAGISFNLLSWPILLIIGAVAALVAGGYLLITHWDQVKAAVMDTAAFQAVAAVVTWLAGVFSGVWESISAGWNSFVALLSGFSVTETLGNMAAGIMNLFARLWNTIKRQALGSLNWIISRLNKIPGVDIAEIGAPAQPESVIKNTLSTGGELKGVETGGVSKTINSSAKSVTDNSRRIERVEITMPNGMTPQQLSEWQELAG
ncbi:MULTISPECIES: phage tail tape measure protein [Klebsiella pneumoniae complex]|uniref:phage tail tape measure protein n=1 Tax=Klebsiella pneumoniae complex TaxID=3390273 RepID=UPI0019552905|nr:MULTISPECIES: phage tail tape measure protein [Klebsiella]HDO7030465.1 phage tail tape measure protein [Klebsiella pneumoniae]